MQNILKKITKSFNALNKNKKIILIWYVISLIILLTEYLVGKWINSFNQQIYFNPIISIIGYTILFVDLFILPVSLILVKVLKNKKNIIIRFFEIILSTLSIGFLTIIVIAFFSCVDNSVFNLDFGIEFYDNEVYVERDIWLESSTHIDVYQVENIFLVKYVDHLVI